MRRPRGANLYSRGAHLGVRAWPSRPQGLKPFDSGDLRGPKGPLFHGHADISVAPGIFGRARDFRSRQEFSVAPGIFGYAKITQPPASRMALSRAVAAALALRVARRRVARRR